MTKRAFDAPLLRKTVEWVLEQDRLDGTEWHQGTWGFGRVADKPAVVQRGEERYRSVDVNCGTRCCVAGKVCLVEGDQFVVETGPSTRKGDTVNVEYVLTSDGKIRSIEQRATRLLGISEGEASGLFGGSNDADDVLRIARRIAQAHGEELGL